MKNKRGRKWWHVIRWRNKIKKEDGEGRRANAKEGRKGEIEIYIKSKRNEIGRRNKVKTKAETQGYNPIASDRETFEETFEETIGREINMHILYTHIYVCV